MSVEKIKKPLVRFKGFNDEWEEYQVKEVVKTYNNLRIPVSADNRIKGNIPYYGANGIQDYVDGYTHDGEFVLIAEDGASDLNVYPVKYVLGKIWVNNHAHVLQGKKNILDNLFLSFRICSMNIESYLVGGGRKKLNNSVLQQLQVVIPMYAEQTKIGLLFQYLDNIITQKQKKLELLKQLKKTLLTKLFPTNNNKIPLIRFKGFKDEWEERKMEEVVKIFDGTHQTPKYLNKGITFVSVENITNLESNKFISQKAYDREYLNKKAEKGDVFMTRIGDIGNTKVIETNHPIAYYVTLALLKPINVDSYFLAWQISNSVVQKNIWKKTLHIAFPKKINLKEIGQIDLMTSSLPEQQKIGLFFKTLDNIISLQQREVDLLQQLKKTLLNAMLV